MEDKTFVLLEKVYSELITFKEDTNRKFDELGKTVTKIEQEHGKKLDILFDGYKQNYEQLNRIEKEVSRHEEVILRRIK